MTKTFKFVCLGGGNAAGYLAKELVAGGLNPDELCIITDEPVGRHEYACVMKQCHVLFNKKLSWHNSRNAAAVIGDRSVTQLRQLCHLQVVAYERPALSKAYLFPTGMLCQPAVWPARLEVSC